MSQPPRTTQRPYAQARSLEMVEFRRAAGGTWSEGPQRAFGLSMPGADDTFTTRWLMTGGLIKPKYMSEGKRTVAVRGEAGGRASVSLSEWHEEQTLRWDQLATKGKGLVSIVARGKAYSGIPPSSPNFPALPEAELTARLKEPVRQIDGGSLGVFGQRFDKPNEVVYLGEIFVQGAAAEVPKVLEYSEVWIVSEDYAKYIPAGTGRADPERKISFGSSLLPPILKWHPRPFEQFFENARNGLSFKNPSTFMVSAAVADKLHELPK